jgi:hypothetical protein
VENNFADASDIALWIDGFNVDPEPTTNSDSTCNPLTRMGQAEAQIAQSIISQVDLRSFTRPFNNHEVRCGKASNFCYRGS